VTGAVPDIPQLWRCAGTLLGARWTASCAYECLHAVMLVPGGFEVLNDAKPECRVSLLNNNNVPGALTSLSLLPVCTAEKLSYYVLAEISEERQQNFN
jgi:hypothetical protein